MYHLHSTFSLRFFTIFWLIYIMVMFIYVKRIGKCWIIFYYVQHIGKAEKSSLKKYTRSGCWSEKCRQRRRNYERRKKPKENEEKIKKIVPYTLQHIHISTYQTSIEYVMCVVAPDSAPWSLLLLLLLLLLYGEYNVIQKDDLKRSIGINMKTNDGKSIN